MTETTPPPSVDVEPCEAFTAGTTSDPSGDSNALERAPDGCHTPEPTLADALGAHVARTLERVHPKRWHLLVLRWDCEDGSIAIMPRGALAAWCRANDLGRLADEVMAKRVPTGCLLALLLRDGGPVWHVIGAGRRAP